jgi:hypothetical protein
MHPKTYAEAARFLDRAERGLTRLKAADESTDRLKTAKTSPGGARP